MVLRHVGCVWWLAPLLLPSISMDVTCIWRDATYLQHDRAAKNSCPYYCDFSCFLGIIVPQNKVITKYP